MKTEKFLFKDYKNILLIILLLSIICAPNLSLIFWGIDSVTATLSKKLIYILYSYSIISIGLTLIKPRLYFHLLFPFALIAILESFHIYIYGNTSSLNILITVLSSNFAESTELLSNYKLFSLLAIFLITIYVISIRKIDSTLRINSKIKLLILLFLILSTSILYFRAILIDKKLNPSNRFSNNIENANYSYSVLTGKIYPLNTFDKITGYFEYKRKVREYSNASNSFSFLAEDRDSSLIPKTIVIVLGESARAQNFGLNGYARNTTPNLNKITNIINFKNAYSSANLTQQNLVYIFSRATPLNKKIAYLEKSFLEPFRKSGYYTVWLTNQYYHPNHLSYSYSKEADTLIANHITLDTQNTTDINLIDQLNSILKTTNEKKRRLIIIHTLGSHFRYDYRYPSSFSKFKPVIDIDLDLINISPQIKNKLINSYDNSILFTDYILASFIKRLNKDNTSSLLLYLSDHGESLYDNGKIFHGNLTPSKEETNIPFFIWHSLNYTRNYRSKIANLMKNRDKVVQSQNLPYLIWGLSNIKVKGADTHDLSSSSYIEPDTNYVETNKLYFTTKADIHRNKVKYLPIK